MMNDTKRANSEYMKRLVERLNKACNVYYNENRELMSNKEFDKLYDELVALEKETGITLSISPTLKVGYEVKSFLPKVVHEYPAKSLGKTKNVNELKTFIGKHKGLLSWKLDGLTVVLTYEDGKLLTAVTRGNGEQGEDITSNARTFNGVPWTIPYKERLVIRGEAIISYEKFNEINSLLPEEEQYANPRNLASGSVRQLDSSVSAQRGVDFIAFEVVKGFDNLEYKSDKFLAIEDIGFVAVERVLVNESNIEKEMEVFSHGVEAFRYPVDGLVLTYDDIVYSQSLGETSKFPLHSIAFKWADDTVETKLIDVEWSPSRTGAINPVAIFEPVELEGTTVERASLHNLDIFESYELGIGDTITVYKANKIIPQVDENLTRTGGLQAPKTCPICGHPTEAKQVKVARVLHCINEGCGAKIIKRIAHYVSRNAMNIDGISEATLEKLIECGIISSVADIYRLENHKTTICKLDGFGIKSYNKLIESINNSKEANMANFIHALGVPNVGLSTAKLLVKWCNNDIEKLIYARTNHLKMINGIGEVMAKDIYNFFNDADNVNLISELLKYVTFTTPAPATINSMNENVAGKTFVITGDVNHFKNRKELQAKIEALGGKVSGSVSSKTSYLINNDSESSTSSKNKKAIELGVPIITEAQFIELIGE